MRFIAYVDQDWYKYKHQHEYHIPGGHENSNYPYACGQKLQRPNIDYAFCTTTDPTIKLCSDCNRLRIMRSLAE